jgi:hypothetical protein
MTKQEFLDALATNYPLIQQVDVTVYFVENKSPIDKLYYVNVRKVLGNKCNFENIFFNVVREGQANEECYFYQRNTITFANTQEDGEILETE